MTRLGVARSQSVELSQYLFGSFVESLRILQRRIVLQKLVEFKQQVSILGICA
jgi:hypothetical protein